MSSSTPNEGPTAGVQHIIRLALLIGVASFGAVAWFLRQANAAPDIAESSQMLGIAFFVIVAGSTGAMLFIRKRRADAKTAREAATMNIVGWALAEGAAFLGAIILLLTGNFVPFVIGVAYMLAAFALFPIE